jgi:AraC family transcriptional regulator
MRKNLGERFTVDDMAAAAMFSRFYFTRLFQQETGMPPARFLSALRIDEAKRLLLSTSYTVADISHYVGYNSPGSFTARFKSTVGMSPAAYRQMGGFAAELAIRNRVAPEKSHSTASVKGKVRTPPGHEQRSLTFIGLFREPIPQGRPVSCTVLRDTTHFVLPNAPMGTWYLLAQSVERGAETRPTGSFLPNDGPLVASDGPITVRPETSVIDVDLLLRPMRVLDPPILLALLDARSAALETQSA